MTNLRNYMNISVGQKEEIKWGNVSLKPFGQGHGSSNLPGGFSPTDRFVRTSFLKTHVQIPRTRVETVLECFQLINKDKGK